MSTLTMTRKPNRPHRPKHQPTEPDRAALSGPSTLQFEAAVSWPVFECLVSSEWRDTSKLTVILIAKEPPFGGVVTGAFLVDLGCLGLKEGFVSQFRFRREYEDGFRSMMLARDSLTPAEFSLAAKILQESMRFAHELGFDPPEPARRGLRLLGSLDVASECAEKVPLGGENRKPFYMAGPDDDVGHILNTLLRKCGHGNFDFIAAQEWIPPGFFE
jgi:hypothetical protein